MEDIQGTIVALRLHPVIDHFTVALITVAVLADLCASMFSQRAWFRYMALTLTILAAACAAGSTFTGDLEADRVKDTLSGPAKLLLHNHARLGYVLVYVLGGLAVVRIALALFGFLSRLRPLYLIVAIGVVATVFWQGRWGGQLVYEYGVGFEPGSAAMTKAKSALEGAAPGLIRGMPAPRIETPMTRPTPQAVPSAASGTGGSPPAASAPTPAVAPSKQAAAGAATAMPPAAATPAPASSAPPVATPRTAPSFAASPPAGPAHGAAGATSNAPPAASAEHGAGSH